MKKTTLFIILIIFGITTQLTAQVNGTAAIPLASTTEKPVYYYIESAHNGTTGANPTLTTASTGKILFSQATDNTNAKYDLLSNIPDASTVALWKLEASGANFKIVNINGRYLGTGVNPTKVNLAASADLNSLINYGGTYQYQIKNTAQTNGIVAWHTPTNLFYIDRYVDQGANSRTAWYFVVAPGYEDNYYFLLLGNQLGNQLTSAQAKYNATKAGTEPGQFTAEARTAFQSAITAAETTHNNVASTNAERQTAYDNLSAAITTYNNSVILPQLSTEGNERWYFLQGQRPANTYLTSTGAAAQVYSYAVVPNDNQLWKFVASTTGTANGFAMVNKATGTYLDANTAYNTNIFTVTAEPTNNLRYIASDIYSDKTIRFWIEHATGSKPDFRLHAGNPNVMNYNGNAYANSSWLIMDYNTALRPFLQTAITDATNLLSTTTEGTDFGQYTAANRSTLQSAITTAQGVYNNSSASSTEIETATSTLNTAANSYKATINANPTSLLSSNTENLRWYRIKSTSSSAYATGKVISAGTRVTGNKFTFETPADPVTDAQLFRFVLTADNSKVLHIINKKDSKFMASNGAIADASTSGNDFTLTALSDCKSFNIKPTSLNAIHAQEAGSEIVNWAGLAGSSSAWVLDFVKEETKISTGTNHNLMQQTYIIRTANKVITVDGVENFEVFSISGQKQNKTQALESGIYIVRIQNQAFKVNVK